MKRIIVLLFCMLAISSTCYSEENLTFSQLNDPVSEVTWKVLQEAYRSIGIEIQPKVFPPERALFESNIGKVDGEVNRIQGLNKMYSNLIMVPVVVNKVEGSAFTKNITIPIEGWKSLKPYRLGIRNGTKFAENGTQGMDVETINDYRTLFLMLDKGRFDMVVSTRLTGGIQIKKLQLKEVSVLDPPLVTINLYHYLHKKHFAVVPAITDVLQKMEAEGRIKAIRDQAIAEVLQ